MREIDKEAVAAKEDQKKLNDFIAEHKSFILNCAYKQTKRYITDSDDEYSVSLAAFSEAVKDYNLEKGSFLSFTEKIIVRRLIDYYRSQNKYSSEVAVDPGIFNTDPDEEEEDLPLRRMIAEKVSEQPDDSLKDEIEAANAAFSAFGFRFYDLISCSPKAGKTKEACVQAIKYIFDNPLLMDELNNTKQLSIKNIEKNTKLPRKILERHRKYIIAAVVILSGEYPYLSEYMRTIRKEIRK